MNDFLKTFLVQSHRGLCKNQSIFENTLESIKNAKENGYLSCEVDVRLTKDGHIVLHHDPDVDNLKIHENNLSSLNSIKSITLLSDVFSWLNETQNKNFVLNIEIKSIHYLDIKIINKIIKLALNFKVDKQIYFSCFNPLNLIYLRFKFPFFKRALLVTHELVPGNFSFIRNQKLNFLVKPDYIHLRESDYINGYYKPKKNEILILWTVNELDCCFKYKSEGVKGVITDVITPDKFN